MPKNNVDIVLISDNTVTIKMGQDTIVFHFKDSDNRDMFETYVSTVKDIEIFVDRKHENE